MDDQKRWDEAIENAKFFEVEYQKIPAGALALAITIRPAIKRYEDGERTEELLELLEGIQ
jgi:hypothetical protein